MTDPATVREELRRLARGDCLAPWERERVIERAAAASDDVEAAAAFAADGGRERLAEAVESAEREGEESRAAKGRAVLAAFERFGAACHTTCDYRRADTGAPEDRRSKDGAPGERPEPLPPRSRNP